jgi:hypothetical protein
MSRHMVWPVEAGRLRLGTKVQGLERPQPLAQDTPAPAPATGHNEDTGPAPRRHQRGDSGQELDLGGCAVPLDVDVAVRARESSGRGLKVLFHRLLLPLSASTLQTGCNGCIVALCAVSCRAVYKRSPEGGLAIIFGGEFSCYG